MIRLVIILFFSLFDVCFAQQVISFSKELKVYCTNKRPVLYKKIFLTMLKLSEDKELNCEVPMLKKLSANCNHEATSCKKILSIYKESMSQYKGTVFGN